MHCYLWEYFVRTGHEQAFEAAYGPEGEWVQLFQRATGYLRTDLLRDKDHPLRYVTVDWWENKEAHDHFRSQYPQEFIALDKRCESMTGRETHLGDFDTISEFRT